MRPGLYGATEPDAEVSGEPKTRIRSGVFQIIQRQETARWLAVITFCSERRRVCARSEQKSTTGWESIWLRSWRFKWL